MPPASDNIADAPQHRTAPLPGAEHAAYMQLHWTALWHKTQTEPQTEPHNEPHTEAPTEAKPEPPTAASHLTVPLFDRLLEQEHRANFDLWHAEDLARDPQATDAEIASVKRRIDRTNQHRNDLIERVDELLLQALGTIPGNAPLHSETPGMMLDRLSILALKIFHTRQEIARPSASEAHQQWNRTRLQTLEEQRLDLTTALRDLLHALATGQRRFKLYRQLKMYNDPSLNPRIYRAAPHSPSPAAEPANAPRR